MRHKPEKFLRDILDAGESAQDLVTTRTYDEFLDDRILRSALRYEMQVIGEALAQLSRLSPELAERFADRQGVIGFRNVVVHNYWRVNDELVWGIAITFLEELLTQARTLLSELE